MVQDLWKPEGPRLRKILSGIINFAKFREEKLGPYLELQEQLEAIFEEQQKSSLQHAQQARISGAVTHQALRDTGANGAVLWLTHASCTSVPVNRHKSFEISQLGLISVFWS